jgi:hypothetical protein
MDMHIYRRWAYLPLLLLVVSLACSQIPGQMPLPTTTKEPEAYDTITPSPQVSPPPISSPEAHTGTPLPLPVDPTSMAQPLDEIEAETNEEDPVEIETPLYNLQPGSPVSTANIFHPELGCSWMGVGGQVIGESGQPVGMLMVELGGTLDGEIIEAYTLTGSASQWGPGGFEFQISDTPIATLDELWVRLHSLDGELVSDKVFFETFEDCEQNAIMVNFVHHEAIILADIYLPLILHGQASP